MTEITAIKNRNKKVEADKVWETSKTRRAFIAVGTYIIIGGYLTYLHVEQAWLHALVPTIGYLLSTLSLHYVKLIWIKKVYSQ